MNRTKPSFTFGEKKKIKRVIDLYRQHVTDVVTASVPSKYNSEVGCGNCGDLEPVYKTIHSFEKLFGLVKI